MRSQEELDYESHFPWKPDKWTKPLDKDDIEWYLEEGWIDRKHNVTEKGQKAGVFPEEITGTETEEHYQKRLRQWEKRLAIFERWYKAKWESGDKSDHTLPFPREEFYGVPLE